MELNTIIVLGTCAVVAYGIRQARKCYEAGADFDDGFNVGYEEGQIALRDKMQDVRDQIREVERSNEFLAAALAKQNTNPAGWDKV